MVNNMAASVFTRQSFFCDSWTNYTANHDKRALQDLERVVQSQLREECKQTWKQHPTAKESSLKREVKVHRAQKGTH